MCHQIFGKMGVFAFKNVRGWNFLKPFWSKSLYRSHTGRHFYGTENVIWAGFWPIGNTEKTNFGQIMSNFWEHFFHVFGVYFFKIFVNPIASKLKSCIIDLKKRNFLNFSWIFFWNKTDFFRAVQILKFECTLKRSPIAGLGI